MRYLRTNTACRVTVGPFFDKTDGVTPETALTVTSCKLTLMVDDGNVPTLVLDANATASGGSNDMVHVTNDDAGFYDLELTASNLNYLGRAMLAITDAATHCPVFHEFMILPANVYDALVLGTDLLDVSTAQFAGQTVTCSAGVTVRADVGAAAAPGAANGMLIGGSNAATTFSGLTTGALSCTTITASGAVAFQSTFAVTTSTSLAALSCTTLTASGAVAFQSTFAVTTSTSLAALSCTTLTASGAVAFQSTFGVTGTTTLAALNTGAVGTGAVTITGTLSTSGTTTLNALTVTNATTLSGAVSLGSTLGVTGTTTLAAVNTGAVAITGALSTSGTTTLNALTITNAFTVSGTTTLTGAVAASNASNNIIVNVGKVNSVAVGGVGTAVDPWGPA